MSDYSILPPFPTGWFVVAFANEVSVGDVLPLMYFDQDLVLYRTTDGAARVVDAHCPHLGAHIGFGGRVSDNELVCPFHEWRFDSSGQNVCIPYASRTNQRAHLRQWDVRETSGLILAWYDADNRPPTWDMPAIPEFDSGEFAVAARTEFEIRAHPQVVYENAVDLAHFMSVHGAARMPEVELEISGVRLTARTEKQLLKSARGFFEGAIESELWGLGIDVARITGIVDTVIMQSMTPVDGEKVHVRYAVTARVTGQDEADRERGMRLAHKAQERAVAEFRADQVIWEHLRYEPNPSLAPGEQGIVKYRQWAAQFYV